MAMRHVLFSTKSTHKIAILIKESSFFKSELDQYYVSPLEVAGVPRDDITAFTLEYRAGKATAGICKSYLGVLLPALKQLGTEYIYCADSTYFKVLTKCKKADPHLGYVMDCMVPGFEDMKVVYGLNHSALMYNPAQHPKLDLSIATLANHVSGAVSTLGQDIVKSATYPCTNETIKTTLDSLHLHGSMTVDIEAFSLVLQQAGIGSIAFAWDQGNGTSFLVDYRPTAPDGGLYGYQYKNTVVRALLKEFFETYKGRLIAHNCTYDFKVLIYELWCTHPQDYAGMLAGLEVMTRLFDDTKIIAYLALNSTAGNELSLKVLAHEFAGNYAQDEIKDIRKIKPDALLKYNLVDCLSTWFVYDKYYPVMVQDQQEKLYLDLMKPSLKTITYMEMIGMPMVPSIVRKVKNDLRKEANTHIRVLGSSQLVVRTEHLMRANEASKYNLSHVKKRKTASDFDHLHFNPGSNQQLQSLLYEVMGLPVIDLTDTKQPATGGDTLEKLINHTTDPMKHEVINALLGLSKIDKILTSFIPAFEKAYPKADGRSYLHGGFNLGGTVSGRLSSSKPNLQNLPSGSTYGKSIKSCFVPAKGWLFVYADFSSLEDRISALITKDPNKLKCYTDGYDGHCLRAYNYYPDKFIGVPETPEAINATKDTHPQERQDSKAPTFLLTYGGTHHGLMKNCGMPKETAVSIETNYHKMYEVSDQYVAAKIKQATVDGFVQVAFGLRVRTPLLKQSVLGNSRTMYEAEAEGRTAGNAIGQSFGLLNNRAANAFMEKVWNSEFKYDILPISLIHDAIYLMIKDDLRVLKFVNDNLVEEMSWQELPEIQHDEVKLGAELDVCYQGWHQAITIPNHATEAEIVTALQKGVKKFE